MERTESRLSDSGPQEQPAGPLRKDSIVTPRRNPSPLDQARRRHQVGGTTAQGGSAPTASRRKLSLRDERLLKQILQKPQDYIDSEAFYEDEAEHKIYEEVPDIQKPDTTWYHPVMDDISSSSRTRTVKSTQQVILTGAEEKVLFHQFNYARHRVRLLQDDIWARPDKKPTGEQAQEILGWYRRADRIREQIAETNLALVLAMAKRTRMSEVDFADLVSEGNMALLRAVDKFDAGRGYKFSTYACRAILKAFSRQGMKLSKYRQRFPTDFDPKLEKSNFLETKRADFEKDAADEVRTIVMDNRADLTEVERTVIEHRFGLESGAEKPMTLEQVGQIIGVTKERVRQIQNKAMEKIRVELEAKFLRDPQNEEAREPVAAG